MRAENEKQVRYRFQRRYHPKFSCESHSQKAMIVKFRERWEKLKESAKKKKEAKAAAETTSVVNDRIDEDPEAEAAAERADF